jgi:uracil DNA glycosylase
MAKLLQERQYEILQVQHFQPLSAVSAMFGHFQPFSAFSSEYGEDC